MKKLTIKQIRKCFEEKNWQLVSDEYVNSQKPLNVICPDQHETTITWNNFQRGQGCKFCAGNVKYSYKAIQQIFSAGGCKLLSKKYENNLRSLEYRCSCGNVAFTRINDFKEGVRCDKCKRKKLSLKNKKSDEEIAKFCKEKKCKFIKSWIENKRTRIKYVCKCGKEHEAYWTNFRRFPNCKSCGSIKISGKNCYMWNPNREQVALNKLIQKRCWNLLSRTLSATDQNKGEKMSNLLGYTPKQLQEHITNHPNYKKDSNWHIDHIFPVKAFVEKGITDLEIINSLENLQPLSEIENLKKADKYDKDTFEKWLKSKLLNKKECLTINLNETNQNFREWIKNHKKNKKITLCDFDKIQDRNLRDIFKNNKGEKSIFIFPHEWALRSSQWKSYILSTLGEYEKRIYARKCVVKQINKKILQNFCEEYHIQGKNRLYIIGWGIFYDNELLGIISLGRHHRQYNELILDRMCFKDKVQVIGGANKLFKRCIDWAKINEYKQIVSFSDNRWSEGKIYETLNFKMNKELPCDYFYVNKDNYLEYYSKQSQKKSNTKCPSNLTEHQWALARNLKRIWDCGKKRWIFHPL